MTRPDDSVIWQQDHSSLEHSVNIGQWSLATCLTGGRREKAGCGGWEGPSLLLMGPEVAGMSEMLLWHKRRPPARGSDSASSLAVPYMPSCQPHTLSWMASFCSKGSWCFSSFVSVPHPMFSLQNSLSPKAMKTHFWPSHR